MQDVVAELVGDREPPPRRPLDGLVGVDPDLAEAGEQEAAERLVVAERRAPGRLAHLGRRDVADVEAEVAVGDLLDRDRRAVAVPDVVGKLGEDRLGSALDLLHSTRS